MLPRERVIAVIRHEPADRIPVYAWVRSNLEKEITAAFGSVEAFEDHYGFDYAHIFGGPRTYNPDDLTALRAGLKRPIEPHDLLALPLTDPDDMAAYAPVMRQIAHHKEQRARFVYVQTPGIFEALNGIFGIENHLAYLLLYQEDLQKVYQRQAEWNRAFAMHCLDLGVDMIHVSDDWGGQTGLLFSPRLWWQMIEPFHRVTAEAVRRRGCFLSLHSDGNISQVIDGVIKLGYQVVHPWQESAGMDLLDFKNRYRDVFTVMGGLDVQTTLGFGKLKFLADEIKRVLTMFDDGGLLYCTSHFVQAHCSLDELKFALDTVRAIVRG